MRIDTLFKSGLPTLSVEFFPPKTDEGFASLYKTIDDLKPLQPSFVSVTYGAGGSTRAKTVELTEKVQSDIGIRTMSHLTCVGHTQDEIGAILDDLWAKGVRNILALRGDPPAGAAQFTPTPGGFAVSQQLVKFVRGRHDFCIGVAGYPEGHPSCLNLTRDLEHLKGKIDAGGNFITTQLFFDNTDFLRFRDRVRAMGVTCPIVAGIMPIGNVSQIKRFVGMCGAKIPQPLLLKLESLESDPEAVYQAGVDYAVEQCRNLAANGVDGLHFYTLNKSKATVDIVRKLALPHAI
jgi:methylenetetrahydrofolate reductase (NADPH)